MKYCIIGCGGLGSIYGAHLALSEDIEVWVYDSNAEHVEAINENGLRVVGLQNFTASVRATTDASIIPDCDIGIIATKVYHTRDAIAAVAGTLRYGVICSLQNGVGNEGIIAEYHADIISAATLVGGHISAPGVVNFDTTGMTWIGAGGGDVPLQVQQTLAQALSRSGLETQLVENIRGMKWAKLIFNAAANPLCALTSLPFGEVYKQESLHNLMLGLAREGMAVAEAQGIHLESNPIEMLAQASETAASHIPSMLSDVMSKRKTEIAALNGGIVTFAGQLGVPCPLNEAMVGLVNGLEASWDASD
ncbi:MAG: ketopantoate reductase family protein [Halioglobus sp.]